MSDDATLLRRYAEQRSEEAFAELVRRHIDLVYSAALRRVNGDAHHAADVAQNVFSALAREVHVLAQRPVLTGWLYTATRHAALNTVRAERRRRAREQEAHLMHEINSSVARDDDWQRLRPVLDAAMDDLSERDREAVLLRFFEQRSFADIGAALCVTEDGARVRIARALDKLHARLAQRGITSTSAALAAALANQAVATAPSGLAASIAGTAFGIPAVGGGVLAALLGFMSYTKVIVSMVALGALALGTAIFQTLHSRTATAAAADARRTLATLAARLAEAEGRAAGAEQERARQLAALEQARAEKAAAVAKPAVPLDDINAKVRQLEKELMRNNPALQSSLKEFDRNLAREQFGDFFVRLGLTPEQCEQATEWSAAANGDASQLVPKFAAQFGEDRARMVGEYLRSSVARGVVNHLSASLYYADTPITPAQAAQLVRIVDESTPVTPGAGNAYEFTGGFPRDSEGRAPAPRPPPWRSLDWDRIVAQAEPILLPMQLQGLRSMAAFQRNMKLNAAADAEIAAAKK